MTENQSACQPLHHSRYKVVAQGPENFSNKRQNTSSVPCLGYLRNGSASSWRSARRKTPSYASEPWAVFFSVSFVMAGVVFSGMVHGVNKNHLWQQTRGFLMCDLDWFGAFWRFTWLWSTWIHVHILEIHSQLLILASATCTNLGPRIDPPDMLHHLGPNKSLCKWNEGSMTCKISAINSRNQVAVDCWVSFEADLPEESTNLKSMELHFGTILTGHPGVAVDHVDRCWEKDVLSRDWYYDIYCFEQFVNALSPRKEKVVLVDSMKLSFYFQGWTTNL